MDAREVDRASLTIGQFARRSGLSHKALRLYDLSGLLPPAEVDAATGYRRYHPDQLERARWISLLRQLEIPLATIAELLEVPPARAAWLLERWWAEQEAGMRARRGAYRFLREQLDRSGSPARQRYEVRLREVPATKVAVIRHEVDQSTLVPTLTGADADLAEFLRAAGATATGERWWIYHGLVTPDSEAPVEVCVPYAGTVDPAGQVTIRLEPAHTQAYCTVSRDECCYPRIMAAYDSLAQWVARSGREVAGPPREVYFTDFDRAGPDDPYAHVAQPVTGGAL